MRAVTLRPSMQPGDPEPWPYSNCTGPSLENRILAEASAVSWVASCSTNNPCSAPQQSRLSTTNVAVSSPLLSTTNVAVSSPLLSTTNVAVSSSLISTTNIATSSSLITSTNVATSSPLLSTTNVAVSSPLLSTTNVAASSSLISTTNVATSSSLITSTNVATSSPLLSTTNVATSSPLLHTENTLLFPTVSASFLCTENTQLKQDSLVLSSLTSPYCLSPLLQSTVPPAGGLLPTCSGSILAQEKQSAAVKGGDLARGDPCSAEDLAFAEANEDLEHESLVEMDQGLPSEPPVLELRLCEEGEKQMVELGQEFGTVDAGSDAQAELLKEKKYTLLNLVCCSLVNKCTVPDQGLDPMSVWAQIKSLATDITVTDPEFVLKVAVYTRQELNIRITANFLLALAAHLPGSKTHLRRYFCAAVQLPSDWLEVTRIYSGCFSTSLPSCLKKALTDKFKQFSEYQLAKYNTRKHRCKHRQKKRKAPEPSPEEWKKWSRLVKSDPETLKKFVMMNKRPPMDKKQSQFNMKKLIKHLHIKEPAEFVMAILGKKYPADLKAFSRSGLSGVWQRDRAGQRMKLSQPNTWETRLSQEGNTASAWEKLIDSNSLPFMAMLRNLRNMITQGISEKHHNRILQRLTSKSAVMQSRQFPFRFLSAYKVIMELSKLFGSTTKQALSSKDLLRGILKNIPKSPRYDSFDWATTNRQRVRAALTVPFVYRLYSAKRSLLQKASQRKYSQELLDRYRKALEKAVQISCRYNIPPLSGRTLIIFSNPWRAPRTANPEYDFCLPPDVSGSTENTSGSASSQEAGLLLAMMISYCCEHSTLLLADSGGVRELPLQSDELLENVRRGLKLMQEVYDASHQTPHSQFFSKLIEEKTKVDNIIILEEHNICWHVDIEVKKFQKDCLSNPLLVKILFSRRRCYEEFDDPRTVYLCGFSEQILRFVSERGSSRFLDHVECIDKLHNIPLPPGGTAKPKQATEIMPLPATPKNRWRGVRVFISSTFRDMHAERDVLVHSVFPELRRRVAPHCLYLQEVELRWGVTEEESGRAVELCLSEVCRSQLLVGILGERYGLVPPRPSLPNLPQYSWLNSAPAGLSITEMEIRQFEALHPDSAQSRMFFYFRSPQLARSVPAAWNADFVAESKEAAAKMDELKQWIRSNRFRVEENYPCDWGGVVNGRPYVKGLEHFANTVMEDLWVSLQKLFVEEADEADLMSEIKEQEVHQEALQQRFHARRKLVSLALGKIQECQDKGGILLVEGAPGEGKTLFMAALSHALRTPDKSRTEPICDVISYSTAASQSASSIAHLLRCLVQWLRKRKEKQEEELLTTTSYRDLLSEWRSRLTELRKDKPLALLVDGADLVHDAKGQGSSEWIPEHPPKGVCLVLSVTSTSPLRNTISKKRGSVLFPLGPLSLLDRKEIVQKELGVYGKKLSDSAFNNQLQTLMMKKAAVSPLYLHLACEELRNYATFETMNNSLQALPQSLCELVQHSLLRLQAQFSWPGLVPALAALALSSTGLRERDLYALLNLGSDLTSTQHPVSWQQVLALARKPKSRVPMATFSQLAQILRSLIRPSLSPEPDEPLTLSHPDVRTAFEQLYFHTEEAKAMAHLVLAAHLWVCSDPRGKDTFFHCDANTLVHLPTHLMKCGQLEAVQFLLTSYYFLYANVRHGLLHPLLEAYILFEKTKKSGSCHSTKILDDSHELQACHGFLRRHAPLLSRLPTLFVQQALNEGENPSAHAWADRIVEEGGGRAVRWLNAEGSQEEAGKLLSTFQWGPSCVATSPNGGVVAVGTEQGTLHFFHTHTNQEVKSLVSNCDGISGCVFLDDRMLGTTSYDGQVELWDINSGCRTGHLSAHSNRITGCGVSSDRKHFATVSLDFTLKVWSSRKNRQEASFLNPSALNCVAFDPEDALLAVGCWDGAVRVWDWRKQDLRMTLADHQCAVRSVAFSPSSSSSSSLLCSGCLAGEVRLWTLPGGACVGRYKAHLGSTQALHFLSGRDALLSAGSDSTVQVWSAGLGRSVSVLGEEKKPCAAPVSRHAVAAEDIALSVAVASGYAAVGYHGNGVKLFNLESGERTWSSEDLRVSVACLLWLEAQEGLQLLAGASDCRLRLWSRRGGCDSDTLTLRGAFGNQRGPVLALAQNTTHVASASDDFTIALWLKRDLTSTTWVEPHAVSLLRGHSGGVTCLAFSPDGDHLVSGGKDKALMVWMVNSSPPVLSQSLPHCHGDWITSCAWTQSALVSCSSDCRLCLWDIQTGSCIKEVLTTTSLSSLCYWEDYIMVGSADGLLMVWKSDLGVIAEIHAHHSRLHNTTVISKSATNLQSEDLLVATASEDGTVKLWHPLQVQHRSTLLGHSGSVQALACGPDLHFLSISEDRSLRTWSIKAEVPPRRLERASAMCFLEGEGLLVCGYSSGRLEVWQCGSLVHSEKVSSCIRAMTGMPEKQLAVACTDCSVTVWRLERDSQSSTAGCLSMTQVSTYTLENSVTMLCYCAVLLGVCANATIVDIFSTVKEHRREMTVWNCGPRILELAKDGVNGLWLVGEENLEIRLCYLLSLDFEANQDTPQVGRQEEEEDEEGRMKRRHAITAAAKQNEFIVCGDCKGNMWFSQSADLASWSPRRTVHSDRISVLRLTDSTIISASYDKTIKLWDRITKKQVGLFVCAAAVEVLEVNPDDPGRLACGDALGNLYFLSWRG